MINTSWKTSICAVASGLLLALGACSSSQQSEQETLAISQSQEATSIEQGESFEVAQTESTEAIDDALAETLASVEGDTEVANDYAVDDIPSVEDVLNEAEEAANASVGEEPVLVADAGSNVAKEAPVDMASNTVQPHTSTDSDKTFVYTVQKGDWLSKIVRHVYGAEGNWQTVAAENGLENPNRILPGQKLTFKVTNENARAFHESYAKAEFHGSNSVVRAGENGVFDIVVEKGDSLSKISLRLFGSYDNWTKLYEENKDHIANPNLIFVGQKLTYTQSQAVAH